MNEQCSQFWLAGMSGVQIHNPLASVIMFCDDAIDTARNPLREKYKNFDLPDNFSDDELVELDNWFKTKEII